MFKSKRNLALTFFLMISILFVGLVATNIKTQAAGKYNDYSKLSAIESYGQDYAIESEDVGAATVIIAIHGGAIEKGTTEIARKVSQLGNFDYYSFIGVKDKNNFDLHITSTKFNEPIGIGLVEKSEKTLSIHGFSGQGKVTYVGGLDTKLGKYIKQNLVEAGFKVADGPEGMSGIDKQNIVNRNVSGMGVQLEITKEMRGSFFDSDGNTNGILDEYCFALCRAIQEYEGNAVLTHSPANKTVDFTPPRVFIEDILVLSDVPPILTGA